MESLSLTEEPTKSKRCFKPASMRIHRKLCRAKNIYSRPLQISNSNPDSNTRSKPHNIRLNSNPEFKAKRNLEDLEVIEKRSFSARSLQQIKPVYESLLE
jgi:hypothetical protein